VRAPIAAAADSVSSSPVVRALRPVALLVARGPRRPRSSQRRRRRGRVGVPRRLGGVRVRFRLRTTWLKVVCCCVVVLPVQVRSSERAAGPSHAWGGEAAAGSAAGRGREEAARVVGQAFWVVVGVVVGGGGGGGLEGLLWLRQACGLKPACV
jgi:hypothetical protein